MKLTKTWIACLLITSSFVACRKEAGPGGLAGIKGKVYGRDITTSGNLKAEGYMPEWRVYIATAGSTYFFEDTRTSYDGSYEFKFLRKGSYDVWAYSDCDTCLVKTQLVIRKNIEISDRKETVTAPDLEIIY